jgi:hypothetical protein
MHKTVTAGEYVYYGGGGGGGRVPPGITWSVPATSDASTSRSPDRVVACHEGVRVSERGCVCACVCVCV